ncbi:MAG: hypothetical protein HN665_02720 [Candidatus Marinimicrobia bacterium]|nr:hypothetical protein [Candidatus Neomarinimicrobiota bacterium]
MIRLLLFFITIFELGFSQVSFRGMNAWTHGQTVGLSGGGYLFKIQNEFRNPAMLSDSNRNFKINLVKYPAGISGQSIMANGKWNKHRFGLKINRINYGFFEGKNDNNQIEDNYSAGDTHFKLAYARSSNSGRFSIGVTGGLFLSRIDNLNATALTFSPGFVFYSRFGQLGISLQNVGSILYSYTNKNEKLPSSIVTSLAGKIPNTPLELEVDHAYSLEGRKAVLIFSGLLYLRNGLIIKGGTSTNKSAQMTDVSFVKNLFSDVGLGVSYEFEDILFDLNTHAYGPGGFVFAFGLSVRY